MKSNAIEPHTAGEPSQPMWDVAVIGGGPAGSTASAMLRQLGRSVVVLEKTPHPRFHIGESLLPFTLGLMRRTGFLPVLESGDFVPKWGARFVTADDKIGHTFYFSDAFTSEFPGAYQVLRSKFDHLLLEHSRSCGAEVRENHTVRDVDFRKDRVRLHVAGPDGRPYGLDARYLADATGRDAFLATKLDLKLPDSALRKVAIFAHFKGAVRDTGRDAGNTISVVIRGGWIWWIPLAEGITSIGVVVDGDVYKRAKKNPEDYFADVLRRVPALEPRLRDAERISPVHATSDFSYGTSALSGDRWLLLGDAGFFLDPIFSSGVHLAITSGISAAEAIHAAARPSEAFRIVCPVCANDGSQPAAVPAIHLRLVRTRLPGAPAVAVAEVPAASGGDVGSCRCATELEPHVATASVLVSRLAQPAGGIGADLRPSAASAVTRRRSSGRCERLDRAGAGNVSISPPVAASRCSLV